MSFSPCINLLSQCHCSGHDLSRWNLFELLSPLLSVQNSQEGAPPQVPSLPSSLTLNVFIFSEKELFIHHKSLTFVFILHGGMTLNLFLHPLLCEGATGGIAVCVLLHALVTQHEWRNSNLQGEFIYLKQYLLDKKRWILVKFGR